MKKIKIGICGAGAILDAYAPALAANSDACEVVAVAVASPEAEADRIRQKLGDVDIYPGWDTMLATADIDAVIINLPHHLHAPAVKAAAAAGKQILCEKVMARSVAECQEMIDVCSAAGVKLVIGHDRRYWPEWAALKDIVASGRLGRILFYKLEHNQNVVMPKDDWGYYIEKIGGGAIMSCLTHQIDALRWFDGEVGSVSCMSVTEPDRMQGECIGVITAQMKSGALALLEINWYTMSHRSENGLWYELIHICGTKGEAYYMSDRGVFFKEFSPADMSVTGYIMPESDAGFVRVEPSSTDSSHTVLVREWLKLLRGEPSLVTTFGSDSIKTVEVAQAAYMSREQQRFISLPISER